MIHHLRHARQELALRIASLFGVFAKDDDAVLFFSTFW